MTGTSTLESICTFEMPAELVAAGALPSPPGVVMEVLRLVGDERSTVDDLALVIETDPVLASRLLGTVNSSLYTLNQEIHSISRAAVFLGYRAVRSLALGVSVSGDLPDVSRCAGFDLGLYWRHSLMTGVVARGLAANVKRTLAEDVFTIGLISNIGRLVVASCVPDRYTAALVETPWPHSPEEVRALGYSSSTVGAALLRGWGLPASLCVAVDHIDEPQLLPSEVEGDARLTTLIVAAADSAVDHLLVSDEDHPVESVASELAEALDIDDRTAHEVLDGAADQLSEVGHLVSSNLPQGISPGDLIAQAQDLLHRAGS